MPVFQHMNTILSPILRDLHFQYWSALLGFHTASGLGPGPLTPAKIRYYMCSYSRGRWGGVCGTSLHTTLPRRSSAISPTHYDGHRQGGRSACASMKELMTHLFISTEAPVLMAAPASHRMARGQCTFQAGASMTVASGRGPLLCPCLSIHRLLLCALACSQQAWTR